MFIICFKIFHNFFIYLPTLFKINKIRDLAKAKLQFRFQYNRMFASSVIVFARNVTDGRMERRSVGQTDGSFESCLEFDYKNNGMYIFSLRAIFTVSEKFRLNAIARLHFCEGHNNRSLVDEPRQHFLVIPYPHFCFDEKLC